MQHCHELSDHIKDNCLVLHDLFGYLSCQLHVNKPQTIITFASQEYALGRNVEVNQCGGIQIRNVLDDYSATSLAVLKIPKSIDLFRLYLTKISQVLHKDGVVFCGFMTRNFTPAWLKLAATFFGTVEQTQAAKKARLLVLREPKKQTVDLVTTFTDENSVDWQQYLGVFSAGRIDYASQFLMEHVEVPSGVVTAADVGSGNGVLGKFIKRANPEATVHLTDDNFLATASGKLNVSGPDVHHHFERNLDFLANNSCDLVVTNPPFHFEYEINMDVAFRMFSEIRRILKKGGVLWIVANNNLPYKPQLVKHYGNVDIVTQNRRFILYRCQGEVSE